MALESFYGGRQGISMIIAKRFDYIGDDKESTRNKAKIYAIDENNKYLLDGNGNFIEKTTNNYADHKWKWTVLNGTTVEISPSSGGGTKKLETKMAEGMVCCFSKGSYTTDQVNYGEYVIIDTIGDYYDSNSEETSGGFHNTNDPDNGKIFRRGVNYNYNAETNPLAGAEYIGQIIGPQGQTPEISIVSKDSIPTSAGTTGVYTVGAGDLVPGKDETTYNDVIEYAYANIVDAGGNITTVQIGFKIPYFVLEETAKQRTPYYESGDVIPSGAAVGQRLPDNFEFASRVDDKEHPFYEKWKIQVPQGIKGDTIEGFELYYTKPQIGVPIYSNKQLTTFVRNAVEADYVVLDDNYNTYYAAGYLQVSYQDTSGIDQVGYIRVKDAWKAELRYKIRSYADNINGNISKDITQNLAGAVNDIVKMEIDTKGSTNDEGGGDQKLHVTYNTGNPHDDGKTYQALGNAINYIVDAIYIPKTGADIPASNLPYRGHMLVYYSDPDRRNVNLDSRVISGVSFYSNRLRKSVEGWVDLGLFTVQTEGNLIFGKYPSFEAIPAEPPEVIMGSAALPDYKFQGWAAAYTGADGVSSWIAIYDYGNQEWTEGIPQGSAIQTPGNVIALEDDGSSVLVNGFIITTEAVKHAEI